MAKQRVDYHRYMASREWALRRKAVRERCSGTCERCHARDMKQVHHLTYERLGAELPGDLLGTCPPCHEFLSGVSDDDPIDIQQWEFYIGFEPEEYLALFGPYWLSEMEERYGPNWRGILDDGLRRLGVVMLNLDYYPGSGYFWAGQSE